MGGGGGTERSTEVERGLRRGQRRGRGREEDRGGNSEGTVERTLPYGEVCGKCIREAVEICSMGWLVFVEPKHRCYMPPCALLSCLASSMPEQHGYSQSWAGPSDCE